MSVYRHVGVNLSALYGVVSLCLNLVPQKEKVQFWLPGSQSGWGGMSCVEEDSWDAGKRALIVSRLKNPPRVYTAPLLLHWVCRTKQLIQGSIPVALLWVLREGKGTMPCGGEGTKLFVSFLCMCLGINVPMAICSLTWQTPDYHRCQAGADWEKLQSPRQKGPCPGLATLTDKSLSLWGLSQFPGLEVLGL